MSYFWRLKTIRDGFKWESLIEYFEIAGIIKGRKNLIKADSREYISDIFYKSEQFISIHFPIRN